MTLVKRIIDIKCFKTVLKLEHVKIGKKRLKLDKIALKKLKIEKGEFVFVFEKWYNLGKRNAIRQ